MTMALARDVEVFLQDQVRSNVCADPSEFVNAVIRSVHAQQQKPFEATPELEAWLLEAADKAATLLTGADFEAIRQRVQPRMKPETKERNSDEVVKSAQQVAVLVWAY